MSRLEHNAGNARLYAEHCLPWLLLCANCGGNTLYVSNAFTEAERLEILAAADSWDRASGGLAHIDIVLSPSGGDGDQIIRDTSLSSCGHTTFGDPFIHREIRINPECPEALQDAIAHEMGHYLGCGHIRAGAGLMAQVAVPRELPIGVQCGDVREFCRYNQCGDVKSLPACQE